MNDFPDFPFDPFDPLAGGASNREAGQRFSESMVPLWNSAHVMLSKLKPQAWVGYRCDVEFRWDPSARQYRIAARFCDGVTNRSKALSSKPFIELIACLHEVYRRFDRHLEWRRVSFSKLQDRGTSRWRDGIEWEYGRANLEAGSGEGSKSGSS